MSDDEPVFPLTRQAVILWVSVAAVIVVAIAATKTVVTLLWG